MPFLPDLRRRIAKAIQQPLDVVELTESGIAKAIQQPIDMTTQVALAESGQDWGSAYSPGSPLNPFSGTGGEPRRFEYQSGYNVTTRADRGKRVSFDILKSLIDNYDIARMAIGHRIDDVRSLEWSLVPMRGFNGDIDEVAPRGYAALKYPEGPGTNLPFRAWLAKYLEDVLRYDAGTLFRRRDRAGRVIGLKVVSGTTIAPTLDYWGDTPVSPAPAYVQFVQGLPWKWFTQDDLIYVPFRPQPDSAYGFAPLEAVLLTANTDLRFQTHFLNFFTEGTVPEGFMSAPESLSSPDQIAEFQTYWDAMLYGDIAAKHQLKIVPFGTEFNWPTDKAFDAAFPMYLMRKVAAAYHVTPNDLGFTDDVNRASSESQVDVQFRIGTLPLVQHVQDVISAYLQDDLGLPLDLVFDTGQETDDRVSKAQAHKIYVEMGAESVDEVRSAELGLEIDNERPVPRFIFSSRTGPIPLTSLYQIAGAIDAETAAPAEEVPLDLATYTGAEGVLPDKSFGGATYKRAPLNPDEPRRPELEGEVPGSGVLPPETPPVVPVAAAPVVVAPVVKSLMDAEGQAFTRFVKARRRAGKWRDFTFESTTDEVVSHRLNDIGRALVRKDAGLVTTAGLCVRAADTGRVLMLQRGADPTDPEAGTWEFPGGHIEDVEDAFAAACREWQEETGLALGSGVDSDWENTGQWTSSDGVYQGFVQTVPAEFPLQARTPGVNPDDPDGDVVETLAWWDPAHLWGNPAVRSELATDLGLIFEQPIAKASDWDSHPARHVEDKISSTYAPRIQEAMAGAVSRAQLRAVVDRYLAAHPPEV